MTDDASSRYDRFRPCPRGPMKEGIHPPYYPDATVQCACGNRCTVGSTKEDIRVEVCAKCHPFFTGQKKYVDTRGRVERFTKLSEKSAQVKATRAAQKTAPRRRKKPEVLAEREWRKLG